MSIPTTEPVSFHAGDTLTWQKTLTDYPASEGWVLYYVLINGSTKIEIAGTASDDDHLVSVGHAVTQEYEPGLYQYQGYIDNGTERYTVATGKITVKPGFANTDTLEARSSAKVMLDAIDAAISGRASKTQLKMKAGDKEIQYLPPSELIALRKYYHDLYLKEKRPKYPQTIKLWGSNV